MKTVVNTDIKMSKKMMEALSLFEACCVIQKIQETTECEVKEFIKENYDQNTADKFKTNYLY